MSNAKFKKFELQNNLTIKKIMIEQLKALEQYLTMNKMQHTIKALRAQILSKYPQGPSQQLLSIFEQAPDSKKNRKNVQLTQNQSKKGKIQNKMKNELIVQGLLGKIAYSTKLLQDSNINSKIEKLIGNKIFQKAMTSMFPETSTKLRNNNLQFIQSDFQFRDELDLIQGVGRAQMDIQESNSNNVIGNTNYISQIQMDIEESSIVSQPSLVLDELNKNIGDQDYIDDRDPGFYQFVFDKEDLTEGCSRLTQKYGYPQRAIKKNTKLQITKKRPTNPRPGTSKFPEGVNFPSSGDVIYPRQYNRVIYDVMKLKVIFDREKTGYQQTPEIEINQGDMLAGRYRVDCVLGSGVFAKVLKVYDTIKKEQTCLKMVSNNKDFFDQALDQIKILRYINANCNPDQCNLLKFKGVFYHRQHLFIETDLLKQNLYSAYGHNPAFFSIPVLKQIARQILQALSVLHSLHIMHADLKPQNILIKSYHPIKIKVVDLGNSCFFHDHLGQYVQSRSYRAPQVVLGCTYDEKIDIWSVGCIMAELWTKNVLFHNSHIQGMLARIQSIVGPWPQWMLDQGTAVQNYFSAQNLIFFEQEKKIYHILIPKSTTLRARIRTDDESFLSFLEGTLRLDPNLRLSAFEALQHPFVKKF